MNTAKTMGAALLVFGVAVAAYTGSTGEAAVAVPGVAVAALLLYLGIGLYSRSRTGEDRLHMVEESSRRGFVDETATYVAAAAAFGGFLGFATASVTAAGWLAQAVFAAVFLYSLAALVWLRENTDAAVADYDDTAVEDGSEPSIEDDADGA